MRSFTLNLTPFQGESHKHRSGAHRRPTYQRRDSAGRSPTSALLAEVDKLGSYISGSFVCIREYPASATRLECAPLRRRRFLLAISLINAIVSAESFGCLESAFDLCFQKKRKSSRCERQHGLWLHNQECLLPSPKHPRVARNERNLSVFLQAGRLTCRCRIMSCCFSHTSKMGPVDRSQSVLFLNGCAK